MIADHLPHAWMDAMLIYGATLYVAGVASGLWLGFRLWRKTYVHLDHHWMRQKEINRHWFNNRR